MALIINEQFQKTNSHWPSLPIQIVRIRKNAQRRVLDFESYFQNLLIEGNIQIFNLDIVLSYILTITTSGFEDNNANIRCLYTLHEGISFSAKFV